MYLAGHVQKHSLVVLLLLVTVGHEHDFLGHAQVFFILSTQTRCGCSGSVSTAATVRLWRGFHHSNRVVGTVGFGLRRTGLRKVDSLLRGTVGSRRAGTGQHRIVVHVGGDSGILADGCQCGSNASSCPSPSAGPSF